MDDIDIPSKEFSPDDFYRTQGAENAFVKIDGSYTDFEQGALKPTNNPLDLALFGNGFFEVLTPSGVRYTRQGNFTVSKDGELVTTNGFKLLSVPQAADSQGGDAPASIPPPNERVIRIPPGSKLTISKEGEIFTRQ